MHHQPHLQGLYDPRNEHDACGVAFVATLTGIASHRIVDLGLAALRNLAHRGASGSRTGVRRRCRPIGPGAGRVPAGGRGLPDLPRAMAGREAVWLFPDDDVAETAAVQRIAESPPRKTCGSWAGGRCRRLGLARGDCAGSCRGFASCSSPVVPTWRTSPTSPSIDAPTASASGSSRKSRLFPEPVRPDAGLQGHGHD